MGTIIPKIRRETRNVKITFELKKDLQEDELVCEVCHGTTLAIADNVYGIHGDVVHVGVHFPYNNQSLSFCNSCYNGVVKKCPGCGSILTQRECPCGYNTNYRLEQLTKNDIERWRKVKKISLEEALATYEYLYVDNFDEYIRDKGELEEAITNFKPDNSVFDQSELRIYVTREVEISLSAKDIAEDACEKLHDNAYGECDIDELQVVLDDWCRKQVGTTTYYPDYKMGVIR